MCHSVPLGFFALSAIETDEGKRLAVRLPGGTISHIVGSEDRRADDRNAPRSFSAMVLAGETREGTRLTRSSSIARMPLVILTNLEAGTRGMEWTAGRRESLALRLASLYRAQSCRGAPRPPGEVQNSVEISEMEV